MLTPRQRALLDFISAYIAEHRCGPSIREMADGLGLISVSGIMRLINGLVERGFIRQIPAKARAIEVVRT